MRYNNILELDQVGIYDSEHQMLLYIHKNIYNIKQGLYKYGHTIVVDYPSINYVFLHPQLPKRWYNKKTTTININTCSTLKLTIL